MHLNKLSFQQSPEKTVFVANIPYDATEQSIRNCFKSFELNVKSVRVVFDRHTGKSRGLAYVEFYDITSAHNAVIFVNDKEMHGRQLKITAYDPNFLFAKNRSENDQVLVTLSEENKLPENDENSFKDSNYQPIGRDAAIYADSQMRKILGDTYSYEPDEVTEVMSALGRGELYGMLLLVKLLDQKDTYKARDLLMKYPSISRVLFLAEIVLGLIRTQPLSISQTNVMHSLSNDWLKNNGGDVYFDKFIYVNYNHLNPIEQIWSSKLSYEQNIEATSNVVLSTAQKQALNAIINMSQAQIAQLPVEKRRAVLQIRRDFRV